MIDGSNRLVHGQNAKRDHETGADDAAPVRSMRNRYQAAFFA